MVTWDIWLDWNRLLGMLERRLVLGNGFPAEKLSRLRYDKDLAGYAA